MRNLLRTLSGTFLLPKASALQVKPTWNLHWTGTFPLEAPTSNGTFQQNRPEGFPGNLPTVRAEKQQDHLTIHHHSCSESTRIHGLFLIEKSLYFVNRIHPKWKNLPQQPMHLLNQKSLGVAPTKLPDLKPESFRNSEPEKSMFTARNTSQSTNSLVSPTSSHPWVVFYTLHLELPQSGKVSGESGCQCGEFGGGTYDAKYLVANMQIYLLLYLYIYMYMILILYIKTYHLNISLYHTPNTS